MALSTGQIAKLTDSQLLTRIAEESSEVIKAAMKHHEYGERPHADGVDYNNVRDVNEEFDQLALLIVEYRHRFGWM